MLNKSSKLERSLSHLRDKFKSFKPVSSNGWGIKFSVFNGQDILLVLVSLHTGQTVVRYFTDEDHAVEFINCVLSKDSTVEWDKL